ncbi:MAG: CPBP family intramembrane metalloprotease [Pelagimonas sp.]|nr:CPBP family intramembrane metalloprotease [Pelagimonas sp.]
MSARQRPLMPAYAPHERLVIQGRSQSELWRLLLGLCVVALITFGLTRAVFALAQVVLPEDSYWAFLTAVSRSDTPAGLLALLGMMGAMGVGALVAANLLHKRRMSGLFGPWRDFRIQFLRSAIAVLALACTVALLPPQELPQDTYRAQPVAQWIRLLPLTLLALLIQTGSEEVLFRGYLQSQLAARFRHPAIWILLPSILFGFAHYDPHLYGDMAWLIVIWAALFGMAAADLTARSGTLGPAIAFHLVNNFIAMGIVSLQGEMSGLALYHLPFGPENTDALRALLPLDLGMILCSWLAIRIALRR